MVEWKENFSFKQDLETYKRSTNNHKEPLDVGKNKYSMYSWSLRTLCGRMQHFGFRYVDITLDVKEIEAAVRKDTQSLESLVTAAYPKIARSHKLTVHRCIMQ